MKLRDREIHRFLWKTPGATGWKRTTAAAGLLFAALAACASPYVDSRREAGQKLPVGMSTPDVVAICFAPAQTSRQQALALAQPECAKTGRVAIFDHEDPWSCTLLTPTRAFFRCAAKP